MDLLYSFGNQSRETGLELGRSNYKKPPNLQESGPASYNPNEQKQNNNQQKCQLSFYCPQTDQKSLNQEVNFASFGEFLKSAWAAWIRAEYAGLFHYLVGGDQDGE